MRNNTSADVKVHITQFRAICKLQANSKEGRLVSRMQNVSRLFERLDKVVSDNLARVLKK
jgi:hypothetical protein